MAISFVAAGAVATGTNPVVTVPAGYQQADLLVLTVSVAAAVAPTTPGGWTLLGSTTTTPRIYIYRKFAGGTESSVTVTVASTTTTAVMCAYRGVSATDTISTFAAATSTTIATNTLTTTYANEYVISIYAMTTGADTWTAPGSTTTRVNSAGTAAVAGVLIVDELQAAAGLSTARTATSSASKALCAGSFSIIPSERYWRGGTGTWDTTSTTNWSFSSGGAGGAPVPTAQDNVFFNQAGTYTVTMTGALNCLDITVSAGTVTFAQGTSPTLNVGGSMTLLAGTVWNATGTITFNSTSTGRTVTTNGVGLKPVTFNGSGGEWTLGSALTVGAAGEPIPTTQPLTITQGTFNTNNYNVTCLIFQSTGSSTRVLNLGSSTITAGGTNFGGFAVVSMTSTGMTLNPGTSTFKPVGPNSFQGGNLTYANILIPNSSNTTITGANTFNNFEVQASASAGVIGVFFSAAQTINGTLSTTGTAGNRRVLFAASTYGISYDLVVNATPSLTDADFRGIYVRGTAAPISGTRIGNRGECRGITFDTPKTVYWNLAGAQNWSANGWATTSTGAPSTNNFPLPQDTATFTNSGSVTGTITLDTAIAYVPNVDMSGRTSAMTLGTSNATTVYGNWTNGSGTAFTGTGTLTFSGGTIQTITSAGKTFTCPITVDTYGGTVQLADALSMSSSPNSLTVTNGTFDTKNFNVTAVALSSTNSNVRTITLGSSTLILTINGGVPINFGTSTNLTFNSGTSQITVTSPSDATFNGGGTVFYNLSFTGTTAGITFSISGTNTFNNLTISGPSSAALIRYAFSSNQTINGTLTSTGTTAVRRIFVRSDTLGTTRTFTVGTLSATDCDFRDITIAGSAAGSSPTRAGDCGGNSGITFSSKTVYWNLSGSQNWSATGWCTGSGGTPDINQFPLAQDTAVFDNTGSAGTVVINTTWNIGTFDASARTSAMTLTTNTSDFNPAVVYGNWKFGTGVTSSSTTGVIVFATRETKTITSNGVQFGFPVTIDCITGTVQLADALSIDSTRTLTLNSGTFNAVSYNVTAGLVAISNSNARTLKIGSGTWTLSGTGVVWEASTTTNLAFYKGTANIVLSDTSTNARTFNGGGLSYNKLTIGGATGISTLTINNNNQFTELASTKTVAHTIALGTTTQTFGKWTVTGTAGNVVTLTGTGTSHRLAGSCTSGIDYLAMGSIGFAATSPGEFYAGANSTATAAVAPVYLTAKPADGTRYWVGGTGNWSSTTKWSTGSGGASGAAIPRSHDDVIFDSASNATAYTATVDAVTGGIRMKSLTIAGPLSGNVTLAGSAAMVGIHGNVTLPATGLTRTYTGAMTLSSNSTGLTFTTNGVALGSSITINGVDSSWSLGSALSIVALSLQVLNGSINFNTYNVTASDIAIDNGSGDGTDNSRTINFNTGTVTLSSSITPINFGTTETDRANLTITASTSTIICNATSLTFSGNNQTFYNVSFTSNNTGSITINGANSFNDLSSSGLILAGLRNIVLNDNQTVTGTLTFSAGTNATMRHFVQSNALGTTRTITAAAFSGTDVDFRDITIAGAAAPVSGTRLGDCKGNSGITFTAAANKYWNLAGGGNWSDTGWALTSGGGVAANNFPLAQDTCFFGATGLNSGATITINQSYNIGTIDMSLRTTNTMTLTVFTTPQIYGNWVNGTGTALTGTGRITYVGRGTQTITSAGKTFPQQTTVNTPGGSVTLQDAWVTSSGTANFNPQFLAGTFDANGYNVTNAGTGTFQAFSSTGTLTRTLAIGSGTWTFAGAGLQWTVSGSNVTVTGTGTISLTSTLTSSRTFAGGDVAYTNITLNQGGAGALTITGNNTFKDITNTYSATGATAITLGATTQTVTQFTGTGASGKVLTISGSTGTLIMSGSAKATTSDYLTISNVRAYSLVDTWYAGINATNSGSLGWYFRSQTNQLYSSGIRETAQISEAIPAPPVPISSSIQDTARSSDSIASTSTFSRSFQDTVQGSDSIASTSTFSRSFQDTVQGSDSISATATFLGIFQDTVQGSDSISATATFLGIFQDTVQGSDSISATVYVPIIDSNISESAQQSDSVTAALTLSGAFQDTVQGLDQISATPVYLGQISELGRGDDSISVTATFTGNLSDSAQGSDQVATSAVMLSSVQDTIQGADTFSNTASFVSQVSDSTRGADTFSGIASFVSQVSDSARGADSFATSFDVNSSVSEQAQVSDIASALAVFASSIQESVRGSDAASAAAIFVSNVSDSSQTDDQFAVSAVLLSAVQDSAQGSDAVSGTATFTSQTSDSIQATDSLTTSFNVNSAVSEQGQGSDLPAALVVFASSVQESVRGNDAISATATFVSNASESVRGDDQTAASAVFSSSVSLTAQAADSQIGFITFPTSVVDTAQGSDLFNSSFTANAALSDAAQGSDSLNALAVFRSSLADTARAAETFNTRATFNSSFLDLTRISDSARSSAVFSGNFVDTVRGSDQDVGFIRFPASLSETAQISDTNSARFTARGVISESVRASDSLSTIVSFKANVADQVRAFEAISTKAVFNSATNNQVRIADTNVGFIRFPTSISDTAQISDTTAAKATFKPLVSETVRGLDAVSTVFTVRGNVSETVRAADTTRVAPSVFNAPFVDTVRIADTDRALAVFPTAFADSAQMSDLNIAKMIYSRTTTDTAQVSDFTAAFRTSFPVFSDTVRGSDALTTKVTLQSSLSELARMSDSDSSLPIYSTNIVDTVRMAETVAAKQTFKTDINETGRIEPIVYSYPIYRTNIAEQSQGSDTVSSLRVLPGSITETARISDAVSAVEILYPVIQESARGSETVSTLGVFVSVASDSASAQDTMTVAASIFNAALSESVTGADSQVGFITFPTNVAESAQGSDTDVGFIVFPASISEGATGIDQFSAVLTLNPQVSESAQGSDVVIVAASIFNVPVSEGAVAQDVAAAGITVYSSITEALRGNAVINAGFLWEPVDDNQTPNWGDITPVQVAGWTEVDDSQSTGWSVVDDSQTTSWVEVDDGQTAGWVTVNTTP